MGTGYRVEMCDRLCSLRNEDVAGLGGQQVWWRSSPLWHHIDKFIAKRQDIGVSWLWHRG